MMDSLPILTSAEQQLLMDDEEPPKKRSRFTVPSVPNIDLTSPMELHLLQEIDRLKEIIRLHENIESMQQIIHNLKRKKNNKSVSFSKCVMVI